MAATRIPCVPLNNVAGGGPLQSVDEVPLLFGHDLPITPMEIGFGVVTVPIVTDALTMVEFAVVPTDFAVVDCPVGVVLGPTTPGSNDIPVEPASSCTTTGWW